MDSTANSRKDEFAVSSRPSEIDNAIEEVRSLELYNPHLERDLKLSRDHRLEDISINGTTNSRQKRENFPVISHVTGGPSLTQSLGLYGEKDLELSFGGVYANGTRHSQQKREIKTICINPSTTKVDECIENMDPKVIENCIPGLKEALSNDEEIKPGPFMRQSKQNEVCLRQAFSSCSYDSRFKIKTKIHQRTGINLDIAFQDEFEMDCCDKDTLDVVLENVEDCFKNSKESMSEVDRNQYDLATQILKKASQCIEDHTTFSCALQEKPLFQDFVKKLLDSLKDRSQRLLKDIDPNSAKDYNSTRLCLRWIDYNRLEMCEPEFFDYVLCLRNGTKDDKLFSRVHQCFHDALKVCPETTSQLLIKILAGAVEGQGGKEPGEEDAQPPYSRGGSGGYELTTALPESRPSPNACTDELLMRWKQKVLACFKPKVQKIVDSDPKKLKRILEYFKTCVKHVKTVCDIHKFSQFETVLQTIDETLNDSPSFSRSSNKGHKVGEDDGDKGGEDGDKGGEDGDKGGEDGDKGGEDDGDKGGEDGDKGGEDGDKGGEDGDKGGEDGDKGGEDGDKGGDDDGDKGGDDDGDKGGEDDGDKGGEDDGDKGGEDDGGKGSKDNQCKNDIVKRKHKDCIVKLFLYLIAQSHAHHTPESLESQLNKAKLCLEVQLKLCPFSVIKNLLETYASVFKITLPAVSQNGIVTKVTLPEGFVWCETRVVTQHSPVPTEVMAYTPKPRTRLQMQTRTTVVQTIVPFQRSHLLKTEPLPQTEIIYVTPPVKHRTRKVTPTTSHYFTWPIKRKTKIKEVTLPQLRTKIIKPHKKTRTDHVTPSTVSRVTYNPPMGEPRRNEPVPTTRHVHFTRPKKLFTHRVTPTTLKRTRFVPTSKMKTAKVPVVTQIVYFTPKSKSVSEEITPTTVVQEVVSVLPRPQKKTLKPPQIWYKILTPQPRYNTDQLGKTTVRKRHFPVTRAEKEDQMDGTTLRLVLYEKDDKTMADEKYYTTETSYYHPTSKLYTKVVEPTTSYTIKNTVREKKYFTRMPKPRTQMIHFTPPVKQKKEYERPTTQRTKEMPLQRFTFSNYFSKVFTVPSVYKPKERFYTLRKPVTKISVQKFTVPVIPDFKTQQGTSIRVKLDHHEPKYYTKWDKVVTETKKYKPQTKIFQYSQTRTTTQATQFPVSHAIRTKIRPGPTTRMAVFTPFQRAMHRITPTTISPFNYTIPKKRETLKYPCIVTKTEIITPPTRQISAILTPTTVKTRKMPVYTKVDFEKKPQTTVMLELDQPEDKTYEGMEKEPTTVREVFTHMRTVTEHVTPTKIRRTRYTLPSVTKKQLWPNLTTEILRWTKKIEKAEVMTPTTSIPVEMPFKRKTMSDKYPEPLTRTEYITPEPKLFKVQQTPTEISFLTRPVPIETDEITMLPTTVEVFEFEEPEKSYSKIVPVPGTHIVTSKPKGETLTQEFEPYTTRRERYSNKERLITKQRKIPTFTVLEWKPKKEFTQKVDTTQIETFTQKVEKRPKYFTETPAETKYFTYTPEKPIFEQTATRTTVREERIPITEIFDDLTMKPTTLEFKVWDVPSRTVEKTVEEPTTRTVHFTPKEKQHWTHATKSTTERQKFTFPVLKRSKSMKPPVTEIIKFTQPAVSEEEWITPTTFEDYDYFDTHTFKVKKLPRPTEKLGFPPKPRTAIERITPSTTEFFEFTHKAVTEKDIIKRPPTRIERITPSEIVKHKEQTPPQTRIDHFTPTEKDYECVQTQKPPVTHCNPVKRPKKKCTPEMLENWMNKIKKCTESKLEEQKLSLRDFIPAKGEKKNGTPNMKKLKDTVQSCITSIGDTHCRKQTFPLVEWILEEDINLVGLYGQDSEAAPELPHRLSKRLEECISQIDVKEMEQCFPSLHKVLLDISLYGKPKAALELPKGKKDCLIPLLRHCAHPAKEFMERTLERDLGTCIRMTGPNEKSGCQNPDTTDKCENFQHKFEKCAKKLSTQYNSASQLENFINRAVECAKLHKAEDCSDWKSIEKTFDAVMRNIENVPEKEQEQKCASKIKNNPKLKHCLQAVVDFASELDNENLRQSVKPVTNCIRTALDPCPPKVTTSLLILLLTLAETEADPSQLESVDHTDFPIRGSTISSVRKGDHSVDVCEHFFSETKEPGERPEFSDECVPFSMDENPKHILLKSCQNNEVEEWIKKLRDCVDERAAKVGLQNPDFLSLNRVMGIMENCLENQGPIKCRPKYQDDFKKVIKNILSLLKQNTLCPVTSKCKESLKIEDMSRCIPILHQYLTLKSGSSARAGSNEKAASCFQSTLRDCKPPFRTKLKDFLDGSLLLDENNIKRLGEDAFEVCEPGAGPSTIEPFLQFDPQSGSLCGPGSVLVRKERDVDPVLGNGLSLQDLTGDYLMNNLNLEKSHVLNEVAESVTDHRNCEASDYAVYYKKLMTCKDRKLQRRIRKTNDICIFSNCKESWIAMLECLLHNEENVLRCNVTGQDQIRELLKYATEALNSCYNTSSTCSKTTWCYHKESPPLHQCSESFLKLLEVKSGTVPTSIFSVTQEIVNCLSSIWTNCTMNVPIMSLPFVYIPLGIGSPLNEGFDFIPCRPNSSTGFSNFIPDLCSDENVTDSKQNVVQNVEVCQNCIASKKGICLFSSPAEMLEVTAPDIRRVSICLNSSKVAEVCIHEVVERAKEICLPHFYSCSEGIRDGYISELVESCWEFYKCLQIVPIVCPVEIHTYLPKIYFKTVGLDSILMKYQTKPLLGT